MNKPLPVPAVAAAAALSLGAVAIGLVACVAASPSTPAPMAGNAAAHVCEGYVRAVRMDGDATSVRMDTACGTDAVPAFKNIIANGLTMQLPTFRRVDPVTGVATVCEGYVLHVVATDETHKALEGGIACHSVKDGKLIRTARPSAW